MIVTVTCPSCDAHARIDDSELTAGTQYCPDCCEPEREPAHCEMCGEDISFEREAHGFAWCSPECADDAYSELDIQGQNNHPENETMTTTIVGYDVTIDANDPRAICAECSEGIAGGDPIQAGEEWGGSSCRCVECDVALDVTLVTRDRK